MIKFKISELGFVSKGTILETKKIYAMLTKMLFSFFFFFFFFLMIEKRRFVRFYKRLYTQKSITFPKCVFRFLALHVLKVKLYMML